MAWSETYAAAVRVKVMEWLEKNATEKPWHYNVRQIMRECGNVNPAYIKPALEHPDVAAKYDILQTRQSRHRGASGGSQWKIRKK